MRDYESAKIWLDDGESDTKAARPTGEFQLWRYRQGQSYTTAAPVRDSDGNIMTIDLENGTINEDIDPEFDSQKLEFDGLDKYDTEGYRYFYVLREYLDTTNEEGDEAQNYEQVFGGVNGYHDVVEDKEIVEEDPDDPLRAEGNRYLYNGGILLNRIDEDTTVSASKVWKAAAFQAAFEGVEIELTLYSRTVGETEWESTGEKRTMDEFSAEISVDDISATMPKYDEFGQEVEYIWLESAVYQNGEKVDFSNDENDPLKASFTLQQDGRQVEYASVSQIQSEEGDEHGDTVITNSIANTVTYTVDKEWYNADNERITPPEGTEVEFGIYRVINGEDITTDKRVAKITMDGEIDEDAAVVNEELGISVKEESAWHAVVDPLVEFDENGNQYEYVLLEMSGNTTYIPEYDISKDKDGNYHATVINKPGPGPRIMVRKNWNDNSDIAHREPVEITAYEKGTGDELGSIVLGGTNEDGTTGTWYDWLGLSKDVGEDNVYILETKVGDTAISTDRGEYDSWEGAAPTLDNGSNLDYSTIQYQAKNHMYEVSYSVEDVDGTRFYTAENRRLGNVNLTVTKEWTDGDGSMRNAIKSELENLKNEGHDIELAIQLRFHDAAKLNANYEDDYYIEDKDGEGYVSIGRKNIDVPILGSDSQTPVSSIQTVDFEDDQTMYFYNLPKYDADSDIVRYDVHEVWLEDGKPIDREYIEQKYEKLYELIADYDTRYADDGYTIVENHGSPDEQAIGVENYLTGTKDVRWKKAWHDAYNYDNSLRPDIYLDIYSRTHVEADGAVQEQADIYQRDYRWTFDDEQHEGQYSKEHYWFALIEDVPKYDELGYEIDYFAIEKTIVDRVSFDYTDVYYLAPEDDITDPDITAEDYIGSEYEVDDAGKDYVIDVSGIEDGAAACADASAGDTQPHYALIEEGTFNNHLDENVEVTAQKLWSSLPEGYEIKDLPTAEFTLYRQLAGEESADPTEKGEEIASITINGSDWVDILKNGSYQFNFVYEGENKYTLQDGVMHITGAEGAQPLSKYDEDGNMWRYTVVETDLDAGVTEPDAGEISTDMVSQVFHQANGGVNATIENTYESVKGSLSVKKLLYLPMVEQGGEWTPEAFPAVTFELWRTYTENDGTASAPEKVDSRTWTSEQVKDAYNSEAGNILDRLVSFFTGDPVGADEERIDADGNFEPLENIISFEDLDIYAPNGSKYVYSVREVKDNLNGYDTWVAGNDVEISGADSYIDGNEHVADGAVPETEGLDPVLTKRAVRRQKRYRRRL